MYYLNLGIFYKSMGFSFLTNENFIKKVVTHIIIIWWNLVYSSCLWQAGNKQKHEATHGATCMAAGKKQAEVEGAPHTRTAELRAPPTGWVTSCSVHLCTFSVHYKWICGSYLVGLVWGLEALCGKHSVQGLPHSRHSVVALSTFICVTSMTINEWLLLSLTVIFSSILSNLGCTFSTFSHHWKCSLA